MSIIVSNCQHYDEQTISNTVMCTLHDCCSSKAIGLIIRALLLDRILALEKIRIRLACILYIYSITFKVSTDASYKSVVRGNNFGLRF